MIERWWRLGKIPFDRPNSLTNHPDLTRPEFIVHRLSELAAFIDHSKCGMNLLVGEQAQPASSSHNLLENRTGENAPVWFSQRQSLAIHSECTRTRARQCLAIRLHRRHTASASSNVALKVLQIEFLRRNLFLSFGWFYLSYLAANLCKFFRVRFSWKSATGPVLSF